MSIERITDMHQEDIATDSFLTLQDGDTLLSELEQIQIEVLKEYPFGLQFDLKTNYLNSGSLGSAPKQVQEAVQKYSGRLRQFPQNERETLPDGENNEMKKALIRLMNNARNSLSQFIGILSEEELTNYNRILVLRDNRQTLSSTDKELFAETTRKLAQLNIQQNTTQGINYVCQGLLMNKGFKIRRRDRILTTNQEHAGGLNGLNFLRNSTGAKVAKMPLEEAQTKEEILDLFSEWLNQKPIPKVVMLSHVNTITGVVMPIKEIAEMIRQKEMQTKREIFFIVDGAQALGMIEISLNDMPGVDAYAASGQKWLNAPGGTGFLYVNQSSRQNINTASFNPESGLPGGVYNGAQGTVNAPSILGMGAAIELQQEIGQEKIIEHTLANRNHCYTGLLPLQYNNYLRIISPPPVSSLASSIVSASLQKGTIKHFKQWLFDEHNISIKQLPGDPYPNSFRISSAIFTTQENIDQFLQAINQYFEQKIYKQAE